MLYARSFATGSAIIGDRWRVEKMEDVALVQHLLTTLEDTNHFQSFARLSTMPFTYLKLSVFESPFITISHVFNQFYFYSILPSYNCGAFLPCLLIFSLPQ